ncbi:MAG: hypothetical protein EOO26_03060 [Comamonadaceae bacterium]|nr:MAG: hypothetical protein EOO26_03060 [Comamonadaceae bacterium]
MRLTCIGEKRSVSTAASCKPDARSSGLHDPRRGTAWEALVTRARGVNAEYHFVFTRHNRGKLNALKTLLESGRVRPIIGARFSLDQIPEAHTVLERGEVDGKPFHGKVVISVA